MSRFMVAALLSIASAIPIVTLGACSGESDGGVTENDGGSLLPASDAASAADVQDAGPMLDAKVEAGSRLCSDDHFCHTVVPKGQSLTGVWSDGQGATWAVSSAGDVLRWDGTSWKIHRHVADTDQIFSIFGTGPTDIWVATALGLLHGTGQSSASLEFAPVVLPGDETVAVRSVWGTGPNDLWAVGGLESWDAPFAVGRALHYSGPEVDGGGGWTLDTELTSLGIAFRAIWGSGGGGVWIHGRQADEFGEFTGVVWRRASEASSWTMVDLPPEPSTPDHPGPQYFVAGSLSSDSSVWLAGAAGGEYTPALWHGTKVQGGFEWTYTKRNYWERSIEAVWGAAPDDTWAIGLAGLVMHWNGSAWAPAITRVTDLPVPNRFVGIWGKSSDDMWVVGDEIALHRTMSDKP
ncbi:hypothetical protein AKJ09_05781 [Labilithrix luteola]|uniref:Type IV fimbrial biogenesis protein PilY1 n=1 Tax=Labilithrix luteola TaxID=1391654 RepID=A0A0K1Q043_9BACT|nr:hypothetical protein [Labilithrix luteola]AKU99117.1 hypothetical protein AKJ09_05781 [Labilithrix luteola]